MQGTIELDGFLMVLSQAYWKSTVGGEVSVSFFLVSSGIKICRDVQLEVDLTLSYSSYLLIVSDILIMVAVTVAKRILRSMRMIWQSMRLVAGGREACGHRWKTRRG